MLRFVSFGSGSSGNCYYLYTDTEGILIDSGIGIRTIKRYFSDYGLSFSNLKNILITHDHADHVKSVGCISSEFFIPVYATSEVHKGIEHNYCVRRKIPAANKRFVEKGETIQLGDFSVTPFSVPHDSSDNVGYEIVYGDVVFCLITDVGHITSELEKRISAANYLVLEANHDEEMLLNGPYPQHLKERVISENGHLSNRSCAEAIVHHATPALRHLWLCHLSEENNHPELARKTLEMTFHAYGIVAGRDFALDVLKRKSPSEVFELK